MEMNTRIQVEHGVTEEIVGVDLVVRQLRYAGGEILDLEQSDVKPHGFAIEARITAENVWKNFIPTPGVVEEYYPALGPSVRVDSHLYKGYKVPSFYDSLVAKLVVKASGYDLAVNKLERALEEFTIEGIDTTIAFLLSISKSREFRKGIFDTSYVEKNMQKILDSINEPKKAKKNDVIAAISVALKEHNG